MKKVLVLGILMSLLIAGAAHADLLELLPSGTVVTVTNPGETIETKADLFTIKFGTLSDNQLYQGFCVDYATIVPGAVTTDFSMINVPNLPAYNEAAYIFDKYGSSNGPVAQVAVWEVVFEQLSGGTVQTVKNELGKGKFYVTDNPGSLDLDLANTWANDAKNNGANFVTSDYRLLVSPDTTSYYGVDHQDFIVKVAGGVPNVPEPGALMLFGFSLLGLLGVGRRRKK